MIKGEMRKYEEPKPYKAPVGLGLTAEDDEAWQEFYGYGHMNRGYGRFSKVFTIHQRQEVEDQLNLARHMGIAYNVRVKRSHGNNPEIGRVTGLHYTPTYAYNEVTSEMECVVVEWPPREGSRLPYSANYKPEELVVVTEEKEKQNV